MADDCLVKLLNPETKKALFGEVEVSDDVIRRVVQDIETIKKNVLEGKTGDNVNARVSEYIKEKQELSEIEVQRRAIELKKLKERMNFYTQPAFQKNPEEAFKAILEKSTTLANSGQDSVVARAAARQDEWHNFFSAGVEKAGVTKEFLSGQLDKNIYNAVESLALGNKMPAGTSKAVEDIANVVHQMNKAMFNDIRQAGVPIRDMPGYITRQTHDMDKVRELGADAWAEKTLPLLDRKTFGIHWGDPKAMKDFLVRTHREIVAGLYGLDASINDKEIGDQFLRVGATQNLGNKLSERRTLIFKNADASYNYNAEFGTGNLAENMFGEIRRVARSTALVEKFGNNPQASFEADIIRVNSKLAKEGGKLVDVKRTRALFNEIASADKTPGNSTAAKVGAAIRTMQVISKLGATGVRSLSNLAAGAVELKGPTGQNFLQSIAGYTKDWAVSVPHGFREVFANDFNEFAADMQMQMMHQLDVGALGVGQKAARMMMKYNGMDVMNSSAKQAVAIRIQKGWATNAAKSFDKLESKMQGALLESGIDQHDWKLFSKAVEDLPDGRKVVTPEAIKMLTEADTKEIRAAKGGRPVSHENYIRDLELKMRSQIIQSSNIATTTAGYRERALINGDKDLGTFEGEARRVLFQFKSFVLQSMNIGKRFLNANPNQAMLEKGILMSQGKDITSAAQWAVAGTALAYAADSVYKTLIGKEPDDPTDPGTWISAMGKSGFGGFWADFASGPWEKYSYSDNILGPTLGQVSGVAEVVARTRDAAIEGKNPVTKSAVAGTSKLIRNNIPFQNFPLVKQGLDYVQWDVIQTALTPEFKAKQQLKKVREEGRR